MDWEDYVNKLQRTILVVFGFLTLFFAFNTTFDQYGLGVDRPWLATALWLVAVTMFFIAASSNKPKSN